MSTVSRKEYFRQYRAARKAAGNPVKRGAATTHHVVGWDGEGITQGKAHDYVLLANSDGDELVHLSGIATKDALDFLLAQAKPKTLHITYSAEYDATMMLRELSGMGKGVHPRQPELTGKDLIRALMYDETGSSIWARLGGRTYALQFVPGKWFYVARFAPGRMFDDDDKPRYDASIKLWDIHSFFRGSFVEALQAHGITDELERIAEGKQRRARFGEADIDTMRAYCQAECRQLVALFGRIVEALEEAELRPRMWHGPGALASTMLQRQGVKPHIEAEPDELALPIACAFFGGRAELTTMGHVGQLLAHDMASAYAWAATTCPSLAGGTWCKQDEDPYDYGLAHVRWNLPPGKPWYPLPFRGPRGSVIFASRGEGWVWAPELAAARAWARVCGGTIDLLEAWQFEPLSKLRPMLFLRELYARRLAWMSQGRAAEWSARTAMSAVYGKLAQQIGGRPDRPPPYYSLGWAGYITAQVRARLVLTGLMRPESVVAFATDALYTYDPLHVDARENPLDVELGGWRIKRHADAVLVQPGIAWYLDERGDWQVKCRGFDRAAVAHPRVALEAWADRQAYVEIPTMRFVGYRSALANEKELWPLRGTWRTYPRKLDLTGNSPKRHGVDIRARKPHLRATSLRARENEWYETAGLMSMPYGHLLLDDLVDGVPLEVFAAEVVSSML